MNYDHWKTGGLAAGTHDPETVGRCVICGDEITEIDNYWTFDNLTGGDIVCLDCLEDYVIHELGARFN